MKQIKPLVRRLETDTGRLKSDLLNVQPTKKKESKTVCLSSEGGEGGKNLERESGPKDLANRRTLKNQKLKQRAQGGTMPKLGGRAKCGGKIARAYPFNRRTAIAIKSVQTSL